ncbi:hypothetical protein FOA52_014072 [Chlamydomonas sp. UWO 241]|nr:hypothetical protein FOA52_014072 [Chlamydomonas sp. UWO 241]
MELEEIDAPLNLGESYQPSRVLTPSQSAHLRASGRRMPPTFDDDRETAPLTMVQKVATTGRDIKSTRSRKHGGKLEGLCTSVNVAGTTIAVGCQNSRILVVDANNMQLMDTINVTKPPDRKVNPYKVQVVDACTCVRYIPVAGSAANVLLVAQGNRVLHVHVSTGKVVRSVSEEGNKVYNISVRSDGQAFASVGSDRAVRLYDEHTGQMTTSMSHGNETTTTGHSMDVFGLVWSSSEHNTLVSGGWDNTLQVWDVRAQKSVRSIYGPYMCGDALDLKGDKVLAGSWRHTTPLELWDLRSTKLLTRLPFYQKEQDACKLYAAKFGRGTLDGYIVAGGSGSTPCVKVFTDAGELVGTQVMPSAVYSVDSVGLADQRLLAVCCATELHVLDMSRHDT